MQIAVILLALVLLMTVAYRGASVILFAPLCALLAVALTDPGLILPVYSGVFMERMVEFVKLYFPLFLLGAVFGKLMEISGFAHTIILTGVRFVGPSHAIPAVVFVCALLTYGGVSLFVVAFAVYPFAAELFRASNIPKRLMPATIAFGAFTFTMDALPGSPQIQNIIPSSFFGTNAWAGPWLGVVGAVFLLVTGITYLEWRRRAARASGEGYGEGHLNEPSAATGGRNVSFAVAILPLVVVGLVNLRMSGWLRSYYSGTVDLAGAGMSGFPVLQTSRFIAIWSVEVALAVAILLVLLFRRRFPTGSMASAVNIAVAGAMLAALNTASEYGFGGVIAALPGFAAVRAAVAASVSDPLVSVAVTTNILAGITGSASGGLSIALATMADTFMQNAAAAGIPKEVLHRVGAMASGGMDTLPHNGAIITLLAITGLTHRQSYKDILVLTGLKVVAAFIAIAAFYAFGVV